MSGRISVERVDSFNSMGVVAKILSQEQVAMIAVGSQACVNSIFHVALGLGANERLFARALRNREYALGKNTTIVRALLEEALQLPNIRGIIIYCSCLDVLANWNESEILADINNPLNTPIAFLYRGPLVKRKCMPSVALNKIWNQWGYFPKITKDFVCTVQNRTIVDFEKEILQSDGTEDIIVLTPGGCVSCLYAIPENKLQYVYQTRFDDLFLCNCGTKDFVNAIMAKFNRNRPLLLLGTCVTKAVGISLKDICDDLNSYGYEVRYLDTNGFKK